MRCVTDGTYSSTADGVGGVGKVQGPQGSVAPPKHFQIHVGPKRLNIQYLLLGTIHIFIRLLAMKLVSFREHHS